MNYVNNIKLKNINGQIIALFLFIITLFVNILLAYNEKLNLEGKSSFFDNETSLIISIINRIIVVLLGLYFVYTSIVDRNINDSDNIQVISSILAFLASLVGLYNLLKSYYEFKQSSSSYDYSI